MDSSSRNSAGTDASSRAQAPFDGRCPVPPRAARRSRGWRALVACAATALGFALLLMPAARADGERGSLGFAVEVDADGFFLNPTLKSVTIASVTRGSPAASAGIAVGDRITEADGHVIAGAKARELEPLRSVVVGQPVRLTLARPNGEAYAVVLVAAPRTPKPSP